MPSQVLQVEAWLTASTQHPNPAAGALPVVAAALCGQLGALDPYYLEVSRFFPSAWKISYSFPITLMSILWWPKKAYYMISI